MSTYKVAACGRQVFVDASTEKSAEMIGVTFILMAWSHDWDRLAFRTDSAPVVSLATYDEVNFSQAVAMTRVIGKKEIDALNLAVRTPSDPADPRSNIIEPLLFDKRENQS